MNPFAVHLKPSLWVFIFVLFEHLLALLVLIPIPWALWIKLLLSSVIILSFALTLYTVVFRRLKSAVVAFGLDEREKWWIQTRGGLKHSVLLGEDTLVTSFMLSLHFLREHTKKRHFVLLFPFMVDKSVFKQVVIAAK